MLRKITVIAAALACLAGPAMAASSHPVHPLEQTWGFEGPFGKFDTQQLQRGYKVYNEVCAGCHSADLLSYRTLAEKGGPFYDPKYPNPNDNPRVKALASMVDVNDIDSETGDAITRPAVPADKFRNPYPNVAAAAAGNGGAVPPDLSVIAKARSLGPRYIYSLLVGYHKRPVGYDMTKLTVPANAYYNPFFPGDLSAYWHGDKHHVPPGGTLAMPPPLAPNKVTFDDGTPSTIDQQAKDVTAFLMWAAEPKALERKQTGFAVMIYLILLAGLTYASYRRVWRNQSH